MGFRTGSYATIWSVESASDTRTKAEFQSAERISRQENTIQTSQDSLILLVQLQQKKH